MISIKGHTMAPQAITYIGPGIRRINHAVNAVTYHVRLIVGGQNVEIDCKSLEDCEMTRAEILSALACINGQIMGL